MKSSSGLKGAAWAAAGAALLGGGMFLGFVSALTRRERKEESPSGLPRRTGTFDAILRRHVDELGDAIVALESRLEAIAPAAAAAGSQRLETLTVRLSELEKRVDQLAAEGAAPSVDQVLAAVEHLVTEKVAGLDERLTDQLHAIELLRGASAQTDALLQKLITAVEMLGRQADEAEAAESEAPAAPKEYPFA